jgi:diaminopimelate epimerase
MRRPFVKMNGLGNDFVIVAADPFPFSPSRAQARAIADRGAGVGCDQIIALGPSSVAHAAMRIWNADGGEVESCGNAARCVAWLLMRALDLQQVRIEVPERILKARMAGERMVSVDMGAPGLDWREIPLSRPLDTREAPHDFGFDLGFPGAVSMGNPHVVFFVDDIAMAPVARAGAAIERDPLFPERVNVGFAQVYSPLHIRLRVWERGVGLTQACGTGACAALVAACRRGLAARHAVLELDGGELQIDWNEADDHVHMTGPVAVEFTGWLPDLTVNA